MIIKRRNIDLTQGVIWKNLLLFFLPILAGSLFQQLYTTLDAVVVGQFTGKTGLAAIDSVYSFLKLPVNFFVGLSTGATILISQYFGKRNASGLSKAVHTAIAFAFSGGLLLSIAGIALAPCFLDLLDVPEDIFTMTLSYVRIYFVGLAPAMLYNIAAGILRAMGDSKTPFYYLVIASTVNFLLDLLFVGLFGWGVAGAALSTVMGQAISAVLVIRTLIKTNLACKVYPRQIRFHPPVLKVIFSIGMPVGLQSALYPIANMMIQANINALGTSHIAAWALCGKLDFLIWLLVDSLAAAISTFVAQNYGAKQYDRILKGVKIGTGMTLLPVIALSAVLFLWAQPLGKLFINAADHDVLPLAGQLMRMLSPLYFLYVFGEVLSSAIRGTGETFKPMLLTLIGTCACRILWILLIVPKNQTIQTIICSYPVSWFLTSAGFIVYYVLFSKRKLRSA